METKTRTVDLVYIAMFAVIMAICSWISIPTAIPFTLQTFAVFFAVGTLGGKRGTASVIIYILLGIVGVPVFSGFTGGIGIVMGTTGGYIVGFIFSALIMWAMERLYKKHTFLMPIAMAIGLIVLYAFGTAWYMIVYAKNTGSIGLWTALSWCVLPYILPDALKILLACYLCKKLAPLIK